jgi:hypothetical protein
MNNQRSLTVPQKVAIDANTNIPEVIQEFCSLNQRKMTLNLSIMVCLIYFYDAVRYFEK